MNGFTEKQKNKVTEILHHKIKKYKSKFLDNRLNDKDFAALITPKKDYKDVLEFLNYVKNYKDIKSFFDFNQKDKIIQRIKADFINRQKEIIHTADEIINHKFIVLGNTSPDLTSKKEANNKKVKYYGVDQKIKYHHIDWNLDFLNDHHLKSKTYFKDFHFSYNNDTEIKFPDHLNRLYHLITLGQAYWFTQDDRFTVEYLNQVTDFIYNNTVGLGISWALKDTVAVRLINLVMSFYLFKTSKRLEDIFVQDLLKSVIEHQLFLIERIEEDEDIYDDHTIALAGIFISSVFFPHFKNSLNWQRISLNKFTNSIKKQVLNDGVFFESSISYHKYALEALLLVILCCQNNEIEVPHDLIKILDRMLNFVLHYIKPNGFAPQFGDNSQDRCFMFTPKSPLDHKYLLQFGSILLKNKTYKIDDLSIDEELLWLLGEKGFEAYKYL